MLAQGHSMSKSSLPPQFLTVQMPSKVLYEVRRKRARPRPSNQKAAHYRTCPWELREGSSLSGWFDSGWNSERKVSKKTFPSFLLEDWGKCIISEQHFNVLTLSFNLNY